MPRPQKRMVQLDRDNMLYSRADTGRRLSYHRIRWENLCNMQGEHVDCDNEATDEAIKLMNYMRRLKFNSLWIVIDWNDLMPDLYPRSES